MNVTPPLSVTCHQCGDRTVDVSRVTILQHAGNEGGGTVAFHCDKCGQYTEYPIPGKYLPMLSHMGYHIRLDNPEEYQQAFSSWLRNANPTEIMSALEHD